MIFSPYQLSEKQRTKPTSVLSIHRPDKSSLDGLFKMRPKIGCPPKLLSIEKYFHDGMVNTLQSNGDTVEFAIKSSQTGLRSHTNPL
jgi:hypothetical protein